MSYYRIFSLYIYIHVECFLLLLTTRSLFSIHDDDDYVPTYPSIHTYICPIEIVALFTRVHAISKQCFDFRQQHSFCLLHQQLTDVVCCARLFVCSSIQHVCSVLFVLTHSVFAYLSRRRAAATIDSNSILLSRLLICDVLLLLIDFDSSSIIIYMFIFDAYYLFTYINILV